MRRRRRRARMAVRFHCSRFGLGWGVSGESRGRRGIREFVRAIVLATHRRELRRSR